MARGKTANVRAAPARAGLAMVFPRAAGASLRPISHVERSFLITCRDLAWACQVGDVWEFDFEGRFLKWRTNFFPCGFMLRWTGAEVMNRIHCYREEFRRVFTDIFQG
jgi:hypothetical protein